MEKTREFYKPCDENIPRTCAEDQTVEQEVIDRISENSTVLPCFEKSYYEHKYIKAYSMQINDLLRCRWQRYKDNVANRKITAFNFPNVNDLHFYNGTIRYLPELSISRLPDLRMKLKPGPGYDKFGELPIPNESFMKRGMAKKKVKNNIANAKKDIKKESEGCKIVKEVKKNVKIDPTAKNDEKNQ